MLNYVVSIIIMNCIILKQLISEECFNKYSYIVIMRYQRSSWTNYIIGINKLYYCGIDVLNKFWSNANFAHVWGTILCIICCYIFSSHSKKLAHCVQRDQMNVVSQGVKCKYWVSIVRTSQNRHSCRNKYWVFF